MGWDCQPALYLPLASIIWHFPKCTSVGTYSPYPPDLSFHVAVIYKVLAEGGGLARQAVCSGWARTGVGKGRQPGRP